MYAAVFYFKFFQQYLYGESVTVVTDHKPVESNLKKPLTLAPVRLQCMMLKLRNYTLHVVHSSGKEIPVAGVLSCKYVKCGDSYIGDSSDLQVHVMMPSFPVSDQRLQVIRTETETDPQFQAADGNNSNWMAGRAPEMSSRYK